MAPHTREGLLTQLSTNRIGLAYVAAAGNLTSALLNTGYYAIKNSIKQVSAYSITNHLYGL